MKKLTSLLLSAVLLISIFAVFPVSAATDYSKKDGFVYELEGDNARICFYYGKSDKVVYPSKIDGHKVTKIGLDNAPEEESREKEYCMENYSTAPNKSIKEVTVPDTVTEMSNFCFRYYKNLKKVKLSSSLKEIALQGFYHCDSLKSITIPSNVKAIKDDAFADCKQLSSVKLSDSVKSIGYGAFGNTALKSLNITKNVSSIKFWETSENFFDGNDTYKYVHAFEKAPIKKITVDKANKTYSAKNGVLYNKKKTKLFYYPLAKGAKKYTVPKTVKKISKKAFYGNTKISKVNLKAGKIKIIDGCFDGCKSLKSIKLPKSVTKIEAYSFYGCKKLSSFTVGKKVKYIGYEAFIGCKKLKKVTIPKNVKKIGTRAFGYYTKNTNSGSVYKKYKNFTIKGVKNSAAHKYAKKNKFKFVAI